jgi:hypothetical protein
MASDQGAVSAAAPVFAANLSESATTTGISHLDADLSRNKSLKRGRSDQTQSPIHLTSLANAGLGVSQSPKSPRFKGSFSPVASPIPLTGAAAIADEQRRRAEIERSQSSAVSENPGHKALSSLMAGGGAAMSKPQDGPVATTAMSKGMSAAATAIIIPTQNIVNELLETSPASVTSLASLGSTAPTATASSTAAASSTEIAGTFDAENRDARATIVRQMQAPMEEQLSNRALSFPGNVLSDPSRLPPRGMSFPMPGQNQQLPPRSPSSQKKHKCPYCETEFTRHHNLKSHLLTHSQEKPYVCQTCNMRFRRLHDLKRHMKLHTGERPHICPKCNRKFARGDALARHSKGQGGCAGRRSSMGSFAEEEDYEGLNAGDGDETGMDGIMYSNGTQQDSEMAEDDRRRFSLPSIKAQHVNRNSGSQDSYNSASRAPSTYPPSGPRPGQSTGGLYPPTADRGGSDRGGSSSSGTSPSLQSGGPGHTQSNNMNLATGGGSIFSQSGMTESPKPLSPAGMHSHQLGHDPNINRQRSPSLTTQFQQQHFGRRQSGRASPTNLALPSPHSSTQGPTLPALSGLSGSDQRYAVPSQAPPQQNPNGSYLGQQAQSATSPSLMFQPPSRGTSGSHQQGGGGDNSANLFASDERMVMHVQALEANIQQLTNERRLQDEKIGNLEKEVSYLRNQLSAQSQPQRIAGSGNS